MLSAERYDPVQPENRRPDAGFLIQAFNAVLAAADPYRAVFDRFRLNHGHLQTGDTSLDLAAFDRIIVVGAGKAAARMALAIETLLGQRISSGLIVVKEGHMAPLKIIEQVEAAHPVPDEAGQAAAKRILEIARTADEKTLVICLFSGGASALLVLPIDGATLQDKQEATRLLLKAGASIDELNAVRKSFCRQGRQAGTGGLSGAGCHTVVVRCDR